MPRKFYKQVFHIEVLTEGLPLEWDDLKDIQYECDQGGASGKLTDEPPVEVTAQEMAKLLMAQDSSPEFFQLTEDGEDLEDL